MRVSLFTINAKLPALLPRKHRVTFLIMLYSHKHSHLHQDGTVARFRCEGYWTVRAGHLDKSIGDSCVRGRKLYPKLLKQQMEEIPEDHLQEPHAWSFVQMDLFGPYGYHGDVIPRPT